MQELSLKNKQNLSLKLKLNLRLFDTIFLFIMVVMLFFCMQLYTMFFFLLHLLKILIYCYFFVGWCLKTIVLHLFIFQYLIFFIILTINFSVEG